MLLLQPPLILPSQKFYLHMIVSALKITVSCGVFLLSLCGALFSFCTTRTIPYFYCESISAGAFLGVAFFHMIPTYLVFPNRSESYTNSLIFLSGTVLIFLFDLIARKSSATDISDVSFYTDSDPNLSNSSSYRSLVPYFEENGLLITKGTTIICLLFLGLNSVALGLAIGASDSKEGIVLIALTIGFQKFFEVVSMGVQFLKLKYSRWRYWGWLVGYSLVTPIVGIVAGIVIQLQRTKLKGVFNAVSASVFVFVGGSQWYRIFFSPYEYAVGERVWIAILFIVGLIILGSTGFVWSGLERR
jgi:zinc transporter ZupT